MLAATVPLLLLLSAAFTESVCTTETGLQALAKSLYPGCESCSGSSDLASLLTGNVCQCGTGHCGACKTSCSSCRSGCGCGCGAACGLGCGCTCPPGSPHALPPPEKRPFYVQEISHTRHITPMCFHHAKCIGHRLISYLEGAAREACGCSNVHCALDSILSHANFYSLLFGRVANQFQNSKAACGRSVLRIHEAILEVFGQVARVAKKFDYNLRSAGGNCECIDSSEIILKTVQTYINFLSILMSKVLTHVMKTAHVQELDPIPRSADNIALMAHQLAMATANFMAAPSRCQDANYIASIKAYSKQMDDLASVAADLDTATDDTIRLHLALGEHQIIGMTFDVKLNTTDNYEGYRRSHSFTLDYPHEVARVYREKNTNLKAVVKAYFTVSTAYVDKPVVKDLLTGMILSDVRLMESTTKLMGMDRCTQKAILDVQLTTQKAVALVYILIVATPNPTEDAAKHAFEMALTTSDYAWHVVNMIMLDNPEDVEINTGLSKLHSHLTDAVVTETQRVERVKDALQYAKSLKTVVEIPSCAGYRMTRSAFQSFAALMRAMSIAVETYHGTLSHTTAALTSSSIQPLWTELSNQLRIAITTTWNTLFRRRCNVCEHQKCFVRNYAKRMFDMLAVLFNSITSEYGSKLPKAKTLIHAEVELMSILAGLPHPITKDDTETVEGLQQEFERYLAHPQNNRATFTERVNKMLSGVSALNTECHQALSGVLNGMKALVA